MNPIILHHYDTSPFAEKIRLLLGFKQASWDSVQIPQIMPKPDLMPLTGGYRRTPVMQVGADVYCDTALIVPVIDSLLPDPPLLKAAPAGDESLVRLCDGPFFGAAVTWAFQPATLSQFFAGKGPEVIEAFMQDRKAFRAGGTVQRPTPIEAHRFLVDLLPRLEAQLSDGRRFLWGDAPAAGDFAVFNPVWFINRAVVSPHLLDAVPALREWFARMKAFGHGHASMITAQEALERSRSSTPAALPTSGPTWLDGLSIGDAATVAPTDYGVDPVHGTLVFADATRVVLKRSDDRAGTVHVHFPRLGFKVAAQG
jgi:glutathione S-transferase